MRHKSWALVALFFSQRYASVNFVSGFSALLSWDRIERFDWLKCVFWNSHRNEWCLVIIQNLRGINVPKGKVWANCGLPVSFKSFLKFSAKPFLYTLYFTIYIKPNTLHKTKYKKCSIVMILNIHTIFFIILITALLIVRFSNYF